MPVAVLGTRDRQAQEGLDNKGQVMITALEKNRAVRRWGVMAELLKRVARCSRAEEVIFDQKSGERYHAKLWEKNIPGEWSNG